MCRYEVWGMCRPGTRMAVGSGRIVTAEPDTVTVAYIPVTDGAVLCLEGIRASETRHALGFFDENKRYIGGISFPMMTADELFADQFLADADGNIYWVDLGRATAHYAAQGTPIRYLHGTFGEVTPSSVLTVSEGTLKQGGVYDGLRYSRATGRVGGALGIQCLSPG